MMSTHPAGEPVTIHLPPADRAELEALARAQHRAPDELLREAVTAYLDVQRHDLEAIKEGLRQARAGEFATDAEVEAAYATFG